MEIERAQSARRLSKIAVFGLPILDEPNRAGTRTSRRNSRSPVPNSAERA
jgi:hypothetical protein